MPERTFSVDELRGFVAEYLETEPDEERLEAAEQLTSFFASLDPNKRYTVATLRNVVHVLRATVAVVEQEDEK